MDFDPSTAVLDEDPEAIDFDPSTAVLDEEESAFDPSTATLVGEESVSLLKKDGIVDKAMERGAIGAAQGVYGLGRAAQGAISQNLQVLEDVGSAVDKIPGGRAAAALVPGLRGAIELAESDVGESVKQYSQEVADIAGAQISEWQRKGEAVGGGLPGKVSQLVGSAAVSVAPAVVTAPFGGIPAAAITTGMQSFGSTSADAVDAYRNQGLSDEEARNKALIPSVASGIATAAITALGGKSGPEALAGLAKSSGFRRFAVDLLKGAGVEAGEETVDQLMQSAIQKLSFNPELTLDQALEESATAGALGFGLGAGFKAVTQVSSPQEVKKEEFKAKIEQTVAQVETLAASGLPQTAAVLAEQDKQKLILEAVEEATTQPEFLGSLADEELIRRKEEASPEQSRAIDEEINRRTQSEDTSESLDGTFDESTAEEIVEPSVDTLTYEYQGFELPISPVEQVPIDSIIKGEQFYQENEETIAEYERKFRAGEPVEPIVVFKTVNGNIVQDGNHRYLGAKRAGVSDVPVTFVDAEANRPITQQGIYFYEFENNPESIERVLQYHERTLQKLAQGETSGAISPVDTGTTQEIPISGAGVGQEIPSEVVNGEDFLQTIQSNEPEIQAAAATEQADEITTGTDQPSTPSGAEVQPTGTGVQNSPEIQAELANSLEDLRPQLVKRAQDLGVSDPEAVANDAILRAVKTAKNIAEARKFANSTSIQQSIADTLRKEGAEIRRAQTGAVSLEEEVSEGQTVGDTIQEEVQSPDQEAVQNEQREIYEDNKNGFYKTLSDEDKLLWHQIHNSGNGRAPSPKKIEELGAKFAAFLKKNGLRDIGGVPKLAVTPPKDWKPTPKAIQDQIKKDYNVAGGLRASLQSIGSKSSNTTRAIIARFLANRMPENVGLLTPNYRAFRPYVGLFGYNGDTPAVLINMSDIENAAIFEETLVHESIHAAVLDLVDVYNISPELLSSNQKKLLDNLNKLFKESQNQLLGGEKGIADFLKSIKEDANFFGSAENRSVYGLVDLGEFVSEAMSNEAFQNQLKAVNVTGTNRNAWKELVSIIKKLLGINLPNTAAEQAFEDIFALIDEGKRFAQSQENVVAGKRQLSNAQKLMSAPSIRMARNKDVQSLPTQTGMMQYGPVKSVIDWTKENFRARGKLNEPTFNAMLQRNQSASAIMNKVENNVRELRRVLKPEDSLTANAALKGDQGAFQALPENVQPIINDIRQDVDRMSRQLIDSGVLSEELTATVDKNLGVYLNRSYEIFDNPKFKEKAKNDPAWAKTMDDARAYLKKYILADYATGYAKENSGIKDPSDENPEWIAFQETPEFMTLLQQGAEKGIAEGVASENEVEKELNKLLDVGEEAKGAGQLGIGRPGRKNLNILKKRKDIPVEIRNLWGEYNDPMVNYVRTMSKMASLVTNHKFLTDVAAQGLSQGWLFREEDPNRPPETVPVVGKDEANKAMQPLAGLYGDETLREAFREFNQTKDNAAWVRVFLGLTGLSMAAKTVGSIQSTARNFLGNVLFAMANGQLSPGNIGNVREAARAVEANLIARTKNRKEWQSYFQKLIELGVVSESASGNTLRDLINRASKSNESQSIAENLADGLISKSKRIIRLVPKVYQSVDDFWKVFAYESEKARYQKAFPDMQEAEIDAKAAQIVRNTYPTYSLAPQAIQKLRRFPFIAPFITFTSESVRVLANTLALTKQELADPATRDIGKQRAIGTISAALIFPALGLLAKSLNGMDDDDEKAVRELVPEWQKNSELILLGKDNKGKISYLDVSYLNPYNYVKEPFTAFERGDSMGQSLKNSLHAIFEPILNEQILAGALTDIARNKTETGREIYNPQGSIDEQAKDITAHLWNAFEPGTITSMERITKAAKGYIEPSGRGYKLGNEVAAASLGQRINEIDATQGIQQATRRFKRENLNAVNIFTGVYKNRGTVDLEDIKEKYQEADEARYRIFRNLRRAYDASIILGMTPNEALKAIKSEELGAESIQQIKSGIYRKYRASLEATQEAIRIDKDRRRAYQEALDATPDTRTLLD
jgi:hypothetical protein